MEHPETEQPDELVPEDLAERAIREGSDLNALVRDALLLHVRSLKAPWEKLSQSHQQDVINAIENTAREVIRRTCSTIAKRGFDSLGIQLKDLSIKDGRIKGKFEATMTGENVTLLAEHEDCSAIVVLAEPAAFMMGAWASADPDQPEIPGVAEPETAASEAEADEEEQPDDDQRRAPRRRRALN